MEYILPALSVACAAGALAVGIIALLNLLGFKKGTEARLEGVERTLAQSTAQKPADESLVQAISELARIGQRNHEALLSLMRDERAFLEPRLQHIYAYLEQMLSGVSHIYQMAQEEKRPGEDQQTLEFLRAMLNLLTVMNDRLNALGSASGEERARQCERLLAIEDGIGGVARSLGGLIAAHEDAYAVIPVGRVETVSPTGGQELAVLMDRVDGVITRLDTLDAGINALRDAYADANEPEVSDGMSASNAVDAPVMALAQRMDALVCAADGLGERVDDVRVRLSALPQEHNGALDAALCALRDELEERDGMLFERLDALGRAVHVDHGTQTVRAFAAEVEGLSEVIADTRRRLKRIARTMDEAKRRTRTMRRRMEADTDGVEPGSAPPIPEVWMGTDDDE